MAKNSEKEARPKLFTAEVEEQLRGKSPLEQQRIMAMLQRKQYGRDDSVITAEHLDDGLTFIEVPDLVYQWALQRPGYAAGKIQSLIGFEGASKTSKQLWLANLAMEQGGRAAGVFVEHADSRTHMKNYILPQFMDLFPCYIANTLEEGIEMTYDIQRMWEFQDQSYMRSIKFNKERMKTKISAAEKAALVAENEKVQAIIKNMKGVQIFDSIAGSTQEKLLKDDSEPGAPKPGGIGGIMADFTNAQKTRIRATRTLWAVNNQAREDIPIGFAATLPRPEIEKLVAKGGKALPFHSSYFEVIKKNGALKNAEKAVEGFEVTLTFKKNKYGVPMRKVQYDVVWGKGLVLQPHTMEFLTLGGVMGLKSKPVRGSEDVYWSKEMGINESSALNETEMYGLIHSEAWKPKFQDRLGIVTDVRAVSEVSGDEALDRPEADNQPPTPPLPGGAA